MTGKRALHTGAHSCFVGVALCPPCSTTHTQEPGIISFSIIIVILYIQAKTLQKSFTLYLTVLFDAHAYEIHYIHCIAKPQEPFDNLPVGYNEDLTPVQKQDLDRCLGSFDLSQLLGVLYEFLETYIRHSSDDEKWT